MKKMLCEDTDWLLSEEAFSIYASCMYHPTYNDKVKDIETQQVNGYKTIVIRYAYEYPAEPSSNNYYTSYYLVLDEGFTMNFGLEQFGIERDECFEEFMKIIDSLQIKEL